MNIESMDETISIGSMIMKGKRTKRPRQPSPASAVFTASSSSSGGDVGCGRGGGGGDQKMHTKIRSSESLCSEIISTSTEEDEDMANCLILLAQSGHHDTKFSTIGKQERGEIKEKFISRKLKDVTTTSSTVGGKVGTYVYECKTCNRSFPSFQALGGHRTSHKKQKVTVEMEGKKGKKLPPSDDHDHEEKKQDDEEEKGMKFVKANLDIVKKNSHGSVIMSNSNDNINKGKIHECSICGAEFASGQALGGHMRRHRNPTSGATNPAIELSRDEGGERPRNILELDLNLPAPPEDDLHEIIYSFPCFLPWLWLTANTRWSS